MRKRLSKKTQEKRKCRVRFGKRDLGKCEVCINMQQEIGQYDFEDEIRTFPVLESRTATITLNKVKDTRWLRIPSPARKMVIKLPNGQQYIGNMLLTALYSNRLVFISTGRFIVMEK